MNLQPKRENMGAQKEFLNTTQGMVNKVGGVTLDTSAFVADEFGYLKAGSAINENGVPFTVTTDGETGDVTTNGTLFVTAHDVKISGADAVVVGALESAYLNESVVNQDENGRIAVTPEIVAESNGRFHLR